MTKAMSLSNEDSKWLKRGRQRAAVAQALKKPMTASEICAAARQRAPRLQLRDVWLLMRQMGERGLAMPLNERSNNGRLYALTDQGREAVTLAFHVSISALAATVDWRLYSWVVRSRLRRRVLQGLAQLENLHLEPQTGSGIRKFIRSSHPVALTHVLQAVRELADKKLITCVGVTRLRACKLYRLSPLGSAVAQELQR
jgi:DNA-binding PadR family transcriptional regulator